MKIRRRLSTDLPTSNGTSLALTGGCVAQVNGLVIPEGLATEAVRANMEIVARIRGWSAWALGDLLAYHQRHFGNPDWEWVTNATGLGKKYLKFQLWGAEKYRLPDRFPGLSLHHHLRIAHLPYRTRQALLKRANAEQWTMARLELEAKVGRRKAEWSCPRCLMSQDEILACRKRREQLPKQGRIQRRQLPAPAAK